MVKAVTIYIPDDQHLDAIRLKPLAAALATPAAVASPMAGTSQATATATFVAPSTTDVNADVTYDF